MNANFLQLHPTSPEAGYVGQVARLGRAGTRQIGRPSFHPATVARRVSGGMLALLLALTCAAPAHAAASTSAAASDTSASPIVFDGVIVQDGKTKVSLHNPNTGETKWVQVGKSYAGYTVGYEPGQPATKQTPATKDTVILTLGGKVQRITLQDSKVNTPVVAKVPTKTAAEQLESLYTRRDKAVEDPNPNPQLIQELEQSIIQQRQTVGTAIVVDQIDGLERSLAEARKDPNPNPELIRAMEQIRQQQQQVLTTGDPYNSIGLTYGFNEASGTNFFDESAADIPHPDGSSIAFHFDANGSVKSVEKVSVRYANGHPTVSVSPLYSAPSPAATATAPPAAK